MISNTSKKTISKIVRLVSKFGKVPLELEYDGHILLWEHPITNEGFLDEDYFIFSVSEKNMPSIWARRGKIDLRQTINDFENWGMHDHEIEFLEKACRHMRIKTQTRSNFIPNWLWI